MLKEEPVVMTQFKTNFSRFKRTEIVFNSDDKGNNYCFYVKDQDNFDKWNELMGYFWGNDSVSDFYTVDEWLDYNEYNGPDFENFAIDCDPATYIKKTYFRK